MMMTTDLDPYDPFFWEDYHHEDDLLLMRSHGYCPCPHRWLQGDNTTTTTEGEGTSDVETWKVVITLITIFGMFVMLISDFAGADSVMLMALTVFMCTQIVSIDEGLKGFADESLLTVLILFIVAEGISRTGALDWYMGKLLGRPKSVGTAQVRLMVPIAIVSAFLNNTPVVAVMIPIVQRWGKNIGVNPQQLLIPLSFASIFGGTCTLIGTSTNLIVNGLYEDRYSHLPDYQPIGLFDLGEYGIPIALIGMTYLLMASPFVLPGGERGNRQGGQNPMEDSEDVLLGARLTQWSPAAGRSVKRSGLRDTGGIYLVSVHRFQTGNVHRAVGQEFVLNVGDILYFTGLLDGFGAFCEEHGLEMITNEIEDTIHGDRSAHFIAEQPNKHDTAAPIKDNIMPKLTNNDSDDVGDADSDQAIDDATDDIERQADALRATVPSSNRSPMMPTLPEDEDFTLDIPVEVGATKASLVRADNFERLRSINRLTDMIRGIERDESEDIGSAGTPKKRRHPSARRTVTAAPKIVATIEQNLVVIGVDSRDRPGLLLDISKGLLSFNLQLHHTEAAVVDGRSLSIWRCEPIGTELVDVEEVWTVMTALLERDTGVLAVKKRGLQVVRARVTAVSRLVGKTAAAVDFRETYKCAIVAMQRGGKNINQALSTVVFQAQDILILQASDDSPLLRIKPPADDFYQKLAEEAAAATSTASGPKIPRPSSYKSLVNLVKLPLPNLSRRPSQDDLQTLPKTTQKQETHSDSSPNDDKVVVEGEGFYIPAEAIETGIQNGEPEESESNQMNPTETANDELILRDMEVMLTTARGNGEQQSREFLTAMQVATNSQLAGQTVAQAGLQKLPGVVLISIERPAPVPQQEDNRKSTVVLSSITGGGSKGDPGCDFDGTLSVRTTEPRYSAIELEEPLKDGDVLWFAGSASAVGDLRKIPGLVSFESDEVKKMNENVYDRRLVQAVIARQGPLAGKTVKEVRFRTRYGAAVIAVHREGKRIHDHPGNIVLQAGDVLLLEAGSAFIGKSAENERSFALLSEVKDSAPPRLRYLVPALIITLIMLIVATLGIASLLLCALVASILMVALGILTQQEARDAVNWEVYVTIACAFGIGEALVASGVAEACASGLVSVGEALGMGDAGLYGAVYLATMVISNIVTNNAAATLVFPIAMKAAEDTGANVVLMSYCLMLGASASFMTPFGYTTNLMIYGPGGYKSKDFLVIGTPLQLGLWILTTVLLGTPSNWWLSWVVTFAAFLLVVIVKSRSSKLP
ncbi:Sodium/sulfate cotransporter [Seminavis robusta]|uniref:Sodium/sulfate cotransporter n=1 Tax=Seminavis robusta TaxID=568900 RepID=A0A9N8DU08_9STRA|nr:Sodium/sulfate cotransporter [Seminavis robusta]|eukprot:Sro289_g109100.1 Sodium/sulfate cotransporter (1266) ;mRNA; f:35234-39590